MTDPISTAFHPQVCYFSEFSGKDVRLKPDERITSRPEAGMRQIRSFQKEGIIRLYMEYLQESC